MENNGELIELVKRIASDVHAVRLSTARMARESYLQDLNRIASTPERQEIWRRCEGNLSTDELATSIGVSVRSVQYFVQEAESVDLVQYVKRGYPKRSEYFDVIPAGWKPFKKAPSPEPNASTEQGVVQQ